MGPAQSLNLIIDKSRRLYELVIVPNVGVSLLLFSQFLNSVMVMTCKLLEGDKDFDEPIHPVQILFVRMFVTYLLCVIYMLVTKSVEEAPFGPRSLRPLLVLRGVFGFFGVFGVYYSLLYLSLSDAVSITFLTPMVTTFFAWIMLGERYSFLEGVCGLFSLVGVIFVAKPDFIFGSGNAGDDSTESSSSELRLIGTGVGFIGVCGASSVYILLRKIGKLAHPLISVSYFALITCLITFGATILVPGLTFQTPRNLYQWCLFCLIGLSGFFMQFCLAAGLQREKAGKSSLVIYTNMVFALFWDITIWHHTPGLLSIFGSGLIIVNAYIIFRYKPAVGPEPSTHDIEDNGKYAAPGNISMEDFILTDDEDDRTS